VIPVPAARYCHRAPRTIRHTRTHSTPRSE
jgi:hypothetical protein